MGVRRRAHQTSMSAHLRRMAEANSVPKCVERLRLATSRGSHLKRGCTAERAPTHTDDHPPPPITVPALPVPTAALRLADVCDDILYKVVYDAHTSSVERYRLACSL